MKLLIWLLLLPATVIVIDFAVANQQEVALSFDPLPFTLSTPLYALGLAFVLLGMLVGGFAASAKALKWRRRARRAEREAARLAAELQRRPPAPPAPPALTTAA